MRNFAGKCVRQVVLADDDLGVHTEIAGAAENFNDPANRRGAFTGVANEFGVDDGAIQFRNVRQAYAFAGAIFLAGEQLFAESGRKFFPRWQFDFVLHAGIVGNDDAAARGVAEEADDRGMRARDDAEDAAFGAAGTGRAAEAGNLGDDLIAVHGVFDEVARDEQISIEIRNGDVGNDEAIAVLMKNEPALDFVAGGDDSVLGEIIGGRLGRGARLGGWLL